MTVTHSGGGWHRCTVRARSAATGITREVEVIWRTKVVACCGRQGPITLASNHTPPVVVDESYGRVVVAVRQCGGCGQNWSAPDVYTREQTEERSKWVG